MNIFVFDIETIPDIAGAKKLYPEFSSLPDSEVANALFLAQKQKSGSDFLPLHLHKVVAISIVFRSNQQLNVWSLGDLDSTEKMLIQKFYDGIEKFTPTLVSWNGGGFDLPVLHYRSLINGVIANRYWENGGFDQSFKWNNYTNRYHERHTDLMDVLAGFQARANAPLDQIAVLCDFPGKLGMSGKLVWQTYQEGKLKAIRDYCETDVLNTYLVFLRCEVMRGKLTFEGYNEEVHRLQEYLRNAANEHTDKAHFKEFLQHWESSNV